MRRPAWQRELADELAGEQADALFLARLADTDPEDTLRRRELASVVGRAIDALPPYHRAVILMREVEGMSYEEMAVAAGVSKGTIMSRLFHARKKLQRALGARYVEECERSREGQLPLKLNDETLMLFHDGELDAERARAVRVGRLHHSEVTARLEALGVLGDAVRSWAEETGVDAAFERRRAARRVGRRRALGLGATLLAAVLAVPGTVPTLRRAGGGQRTRGSRAFDTR
jgi:hypothetical protein